MRNHKERENYLFEMTIKGKYLDDLLECVVYRAHKPNEYVIWYYFTNSDTSTCMAYGSFDRLYKYLLYEYSEEDANIFKEAFIKCPKTRKDFIKEL